MSSASPMTTRRQIKRHYAFLLEGLKDVEEALGERGIKFVVGRGSPDEVALSFGERVSIILCDGGEYLRTEKEWRKSVAEGAFCRVVRVESNAVVPVEVASNKREHAARTLRPKIRAYLDELLVELAPTQVEKTYLGMEIEGGLDLSDIDAVSESMNLDGEAWPLSISTLAVRRRQRRSSRSS